MAGLCPFEIRSGGPEVGLDVPPVMLSPRGGAETPAPASLAPFLQLGMGAGPVATASPGAGVVDRSCGRAGAGRWESQPSVGEPQGARATEPSGAVHPGGPSTGRAVHPGGLTPFVLLHFLHRRFCASRSSPSWTSPQT